MGIEPKTIYRWINGENYPSWEQLEAFAATVGPLRLELGTTKEAAPSEEGAAETLLRLWSGQQAPDWASGLTDSILTAIRDDQTIRFADLAHEIGRQVGEALRQHQQPLPDVSTRAAEDQ